MLKRFVLLLLPIILFSCVNTSLSVRKGAIPDWVNDVYSVFNRNSFIAATGYGSSRAIAESNALASLTAFFGQTIEVERTAISSYQQAVVNGALDYWINTAEMRTNIKTTISMDNLMGAEIKEVWFDSKDTFYAVAVIDKAVSVRIYRELLNANLKLTAELVNVSSADKNSIDSFRRYMFAGVVADISISYRNILEILDAPVSETVINGDYYRLEAQKIAKTIPVGIKISNDRNGRVFGAFAKCFIDWGFETVVVTPAAAAQTRYILDVSAVLSPVNLPDNPNYFSRIELAATFTDTKDDSILISYTFNSREGHVSLSEAENRCFLAAERAINDEFVFLLFILFSYS